MGVVVEAVKKFFDAFVNKGVVRDVVGPILQLRGRRQFSVQEQVSRFQIGALLREILDWIAAITQDAGVAVDVSHAADAGSGVVEGRVIAHQAEFFGVDFDLAKVGSPDGSVSDGDFVGFAGAIVDDGESFAGRGSAVRFSRLRCREWRAHSQVLRGSEAFAFFPYHFTPKGGRVKTEPADKLQGLWIQAARARSAGRAEEP